MSWFLLLDVGSHLLGCLSLHQEYSAGSREELVLSLGPPEGGSRGMPSWAHCLGGLLPPSQASWFHMAPSSAPTHGM